MPTTIDSAGITFNDATSLTSAVIPANAVGATQIANGSVTAVKLGTNEQKQIAKAWVNFDGTTSPGTIRSSFNVSSVTKFATGGYQVNFTTPLNTTNSTVSGTASISGSKLCVYGVDGGFLQNSVSIATATSGGITSQSDASTVTIQVFGN